MLLNKLGQKSYLELSSNKRQLKKKGLTSNGRPFLKNAPYSLSGWGPR